MDISFLINFKDNSRYYLPNITYDFFEKYLFKSGASDIEYEDYLRVNVMKELSDFDSDSIKNSILTYVDSNKKRVIHFKCVYDSDEVI